MKLNEKEGTFICDVCGKFYEGTIIEVIELIKRKPSEISETYCSKECEKRAIYRDLNVGKQRTILEIDVAHAIEDLFKMNCSKEEIMKGLGLKKEEYEFYLSLLGVSK